MLFNSLIEITLILYFSPQLFLIFGKLIKKRRVQMSTTVEQINASEIQVKIENVYKSFPKGNRENLVLRDINLEIKKGEFISLLGPSGCGKSTLLKIMGGLLETTSGQLMVGDEEIKGPRKEIGFMFQKAVLLPWRTVEQNLLLPVESCEWRFGSCQSTNS